MTSPQGTGAADVYEVVVEELTPPAGPLRTVFSTLRAIVVRAPGAPEPEVVIVSVRRKRDGLELFRHIEDASDGEGHVIDGLRSDLDSMTATDFAARFNH